MKLTALLLILTMTFGCGLFGKNKEPIVSKIGETVQRAAIKHLECSTGDPVREDVEEYASKLFKTSPGQSDAKGIGSDVCSYAVSLALPYLVNLGNNQLPPSWVEDGCNLSKAGGALETLTKRLCGLIPY